MSLVWFGANSMLEGILTYLCIALFFLIAALIRKNIFNDMWAMDFNLLFATVFAEVGFVGTLILIHVIWHFHSIKWALGVGLILMLLAGLLFKNLWGFGQADGGDGETNYE